MSVRLVWQSISLRDDDELIEVKATDDRKIYPCNEYGQCIRFKESDVRVPDEYRWGFVVLICLMAMKLLQCS